MILFATGPPDLGKIQLGYPERRSCSTSDFEPLTSVIVADALGKEVRITKGSIDERNVSQLSPMPANLVEQIPEPDFYNLLSYLLSLRPTKETKPGQ